ncbi:hypothetical protein [Saccharicrinis aurantiacus]|uniref:hypothetical protein n=1 Tax=Saccharicrinis aurantiacus TaxID=1849719 RepID=UPI000950016A|nr:hypothetical protein [Saccharicrinis aurantiacus]
MKINRYLFISILAIVIALFYLDGKLFYYGKSSFNFCDLNTLQVRPKSIPEFEGGFCFIDNSGFEIIGQGFKYKGYDTVEVNTILGYGYDIEELAVLIESADNRQYYAKFIDDKAVVTKSLAVEIVNQDEYIGIDNLEWVDLSSTSQGKAFELTRNYLVLLLVIMSLILIFRIIRKKDDKNKKAPRSA